MKMGSIMEYDNNEAKSLKGQADIWKYMFSFVDSMALKCAVELRIADIINSHGHPITLPEIAAGISGTASPDISFLARIMRLLVRRNIFAAHRSPDGASGETLYGLTQSSRWLVRDAPTEMNLGTIVLLNCHPWMMGPWRYLSQCVKEGGNGFEKANGRQLFEFASESSEFNKLFNDTMHSMTKICLEAMFSEYKEGFGCLSSLVDVGGGTGGVVAEIVKAYPQIKGINFDLPHVIATAPEYPGVSHVQGDMFKAIPKADAVFIKWVLHNWSDEECVLILNNCRKAIPERNGKVIIMDAILEPEGNDLFDDTGVVFDLLMLTELSGKERTEAEWKKVLKEAGFPRYKIVKIPALSSIIEAYPV